MLASRQENGGAVQAQVKNGGRYLAPAVLGAAAVIAADQVSKWYVFEHYLRLKGEAAAFMPWLMNARAFTSYMPEDFRMVALAPFLNIVMVWNQGVSFGLFGGGAAPLIFVGISLTICAVMGYWLWTARNKWVASAVSMIIGGALGNVLDRLRFGAVADFIDFYAGAWHWPAFNVADSAVVVGAGLLILDALKKEEHHEKK